MDVENNRVFLEPLGRLVVVAVGSFSPLVSLWSTVVLVAGYAQNDSVKFLVVVGTTG